MKNKLPALTAVVLLAAGGMFGYRSYRHERDAAAESRPAMPVASTGVDSSPAGPTAGDQLLLEARTQLERRTSVTARLRHQVSLDGRQLFGVGGYWQQGSGEDLHMRLELQIANQETGLLQVSNGRFLWTDQRLPAGRWIRRLDLRKVRSEWSRAEQELEDLEPGRAAWTSIEPELSVRYGGLPTLLLSLSDCFTFLPPQSMRWTPTPPLAGLPESFPVFAVVGHWKPEVLAIYVPAGQDATALPERLPQEVLVLFGQSDLFPYRIEYRKQLTPRTPTAADGQVASFQLSREPLALLELSAVSFAGQIAAGQFDFSPGDAEWDDCTAEYLEATQLHRQSRMAARKQPAH
ncbi:MAG: hypothetical protein WD971_04680 [Pirellulales bacterium]